MEDYLGSLQNTASDSISAAIEAQISVIRYVKSPELLDSTFDLIIADMKKALKACDTERQKEDIREKFSLVTQNYIFFLNAKCEFQKQVNRAEMSQLLGDATRQLIKTSGEIAKMAVESKQKNNKVKIDTNQIANTLLQDLSQENGLVDQVFRWFNKKSIQKQNEQAFINSLKTLFNKLYKNRNAIGRSDLISGLIERYAEKIAQHETRSDYEQIRTDEQLKPSGTPIYIIAGLGLVTLIARWLIYGIRSMVNGIGNWTGGTGGDNWALYHILVFSAISVGYYLYNKNVFENRKKARDEAKAEADSNLCRIYDNYIAMAQCFEDKF